MLGNKTASGQQQQQSAATRRIDAQFVESAEPSEGGPLLVVSYGGGNSPTGNKAALLLLQRSQKLNDHIQRSFLRSLSRVSSPLDGESVSFLCITGLFFKSWRCRWIGLCSCSAAAMNSRLWMDECTWTQLRHLSDNSVWTKWWLVCVCTTVVWSKTTWLLAGKGNRFTVVLTSCFSAVFILKESKKKRKKERRSKRVCNSARCWLS